MGSLCGYCTPLEYAQVKVKPHQLLQPSTFCWDCFLWLNINNVDFAQGGRLTSSSDLEGGSGRHARTFEASHLSLRS